MSQSTTCSGCCSRKRTAEEDDLRDTVIETLTCAVCLELLVNDIFQCPHGHPICGDCRSKLPGPIKRCPSCGSTQLDIRNRMCEKIAEKLELACPHEGCAETVLAPSLKAHKAACPLGPLRCSVLHPTCDFTGTAEALVGHLTNRHDVFPLADRIGFHTSATLSVNGGAHRKNEYLSANCTAWFASLKQGPASYVLRVVRPPSPLGQGTFHASLLYLPPQGDARDQTATIRFCPREGLSSPRPTVTVSGVRVMNLRTATGIPTQGIKISSLLPVGCEAVLSDRQAVYMSGGTGCETDALPDSFQIRFQIVMQ